MFDFRLTGYPDIIMMIGKGRQGILKFISFCIEYFVKLNGI